jgi:putative ABC transport system substrate-binding protein
MTLLGGAVAWPIGACGEPSAIPVIGYLSAGSRESMLILGSFLQGLRETGFTEGKNLAVESRWAEGHNDRLPALAAELVGRRVAVIATGIGTPAALAAKAATTTIPIVFVTGLDPVQSGLVASFNRPGGNLTGFTDANRVILSKRLGLLHELVPVGRRFAVLEDANLPGNESIIRELRAVASTIGAEIEDFSPNSAAEMDDTFTRLAEKKIDGLMLRPRPLFSDLPAQIVGLAARHSLPTIYYDRRFVEAGGLISYATDNFDQLRQAGVYAGRILKGERPTDLPVQQPTKFSLVINLKTAKALGVTVPTSLLATADEVIE